MGHYKIPSGELAKPAGLFFGVFSAIFWGLTAISRGGFTGWFNFFAASFAAVSLGYLT